MTRVFQYDGEVIDSTNKNRQGKSGNTQPEVKEGEGETEVKAEEGEVTAKADADDILDEQTKAELAEDAPSP